MRVTVPRDEAELAADALCAAGAAGVEERAGDADRDEVVLVTGPPAGGDAAPLLAAVARRWTAELVEVDLGAALDAWRDHARPVRVGRLVVRPPWIDPAAVDDPSVILGPGDQELVIDPGRTFGSGAHASTRLALALLADLVRPGDRMLDLGCGSGVLGIAAARLGAEAVVAVDLDPAAIDATRANAARNGVADRVTAVEADAAEAGACAPTPIDGGFDLVVANLLLPDLVAAAPTVRAALARDGRVVLAGLLAVQRDAAVAAYDAVGLGPTGAPRSEDDWIALVLADPGEVRVR